MILNPDRLLRNKEKALKKIAREKSYGDVRQLLDRTQDDDIRRAVATRMIELRPDAAMALVLNPNEAVGRVALEAIDSQDDLVKVATNPGCELGIRLQALDRLDSDRVVLAAIDACKTSHNGAAVVMNDFDRERVMLNAVRKLNDRNALRQIAFDDDAGFEVRLAALESMGASSEELFQMAAEGCWPAVQLLDQDALARLVRLAVEQAEPLGFSVCIETDGQMQWIQKKSSKKPIASSAVAAIRRVEDDELAFTLALECMQIGELELIPKLVSDRFDDQSRRCQLGVHDYKCLGHDHEHYGEHITEYDIYECQCCKHRYNKETDYWKW